MILNKKQIYEACDCEYAIVPVPEWGGEVRIKSMSIDEQMKYEDNKKDKSSADSILALVFASCVDEDDNRMFDSEEDLKALYKKSTKVILRIFEQCMKLNSSSDINLEAEAKNL